MKYFEILNSIKEIDALMSRTPQNNEDRAQRNDFVKHELSIIIARCSEIITELDNENNKILKAGKVSQTEFDIWK